MKDKELESNIDSLMELSSRIRCIGELSEFAVAQLHFYQEKNKDKGVIDLLEILNAGVEKGRKYVMFIWNVTIEASVAICRIVLMKPTKNLIN